MERVGVREVRQNLSRYLHEVKEGETFVVTERGREVARLSPSGPADSPIARLVAEHGARSSMNCARSGCSGPARVSGQLRLREAAARRVAPRRATQRIARLLDRLGELTMPPATDPRLGYQWEVDGQLIELLAPDGLSADPRTTGNYETIQIDGGTRSRLPNSSWLARPSSS